MIRSVQFTLLVLLQVSFLNAQGDFQKIYRPNNSSFANVMSVQQTSDGGYCLAGIDSVSAITDRDFYLVKTDTNGDTIWSRSYGTSNYDYCQYVIQTNDGGYMMAGTSSGADWNIYLVRAGANGDTLWTRSYGGPFDDEANSVEQLPNGTFMVAGYTNGFGAGNYDYLLMNLDVNGDILWAKAYGTLADELGYFVQRTNDKGYIVSGAAAAPNATIDAYCIKTDSTGAVQWSNYYGTLFTDWGYMMRQTMDSGYILTGYVEAGATTDAFLIKTDGAGDTVWTKAYGGTGFEVGLCVQQVADSGYVMSGQVFSGSFGASDALLLKVDANGNVVFMNCFGGTGDETAPAFVQTTDGGYALGAYTNSLAGTAYNCFFIKTDSAGNTDNNCNQNALALLTSQRAFAVSAAATQVNPISFTRQYFTTLVDSGALQISPCVTMGITNKDLSSSLLVYPNPGRGVFNLEAGNISGPFVGITLSNVLGEILQTKNIQNQTGYLNERFDLSTFAPGTYFIRVQAGESSLSARMVITD